MSKPSPATGKVQELAAVLKPLDRRLEAASSLAFSGSDVERILTTFHDADSWRRRG